MEKGNMSKPSKLRRLNKSPSRPTLEPSSSTIRILLGVILLYFYTSSIMFFLFHHHRSKISDFHDNLSSQHRQLVLQETESIEEKCSKHPSWRNDIAWKRAISNPKLCGLTTSQRDRNYTSSEQQQLLLFEETMFNYSHFKEPPCGQYCIYPLQSMYSYSYGQHVMGYALQSSLDSPHIKCWRPFTTQYEYNPCGKQHYNEWIGIMEPYIGTDMIPAYQCRSRNHSVTGGILLASEGGTNRSEATNYGSDVVSEGNDQCQGIQIINEFILQRSIDAYKCIQRKKQMNATTYEKMKRWLTASSSSDRKQLQKKIDVYTMRTKSRQEVEQPSPFCKKQILNISNPSDVLFLYDIHQLGLHYLVDALTIFNYSTSIATTNLTCDDDDEHNICVYHHQSVPASSDDEKSPLKGWEYSNMYQCFIPIVDMKLHPKCDRTSSQYNSWLQSVVKQQTDTTMDSSMSLSKKASESASKCTLCDQLPTPSGQYFWDYNKQSYKATHIPPTDKIRSASVCGPRIIFAGAEECGMNSLPPLLALHPRIKLNLCPNSSLEKCNYKYFQGDYNNFTNKISSIWVSHGLSHEYIADPINYIGKYAQKLPRIYPGEKEVTFDVSTTYINTNTFPNIAQRTHELLPNAKIIFAVCDPVKRMHSEFDKSWNHQSFEELFYRNHHVRVPNDFNEYVQDMDLESKNCKDNPQFCYELRRDKLESGLYLKHLQQWKNYYGRDNILVLNMEDTNEHKLKQVFKVMGDCLPESEYPWASLFPENEYKKVGDEQNVSVYMAADEWLYKYFADSNAALSYEIKELYPIKWRL